MGVRVWCGDDAGAVNVVERGVTAEDYHRVDIDVYKCSAIVRVFSAPYLKIGETLFSYSGNVHKLVDDINDWLVRQELRGWS